jgi:cytochrome c
MTRLPIAVLAAMGMSLAGAVRAAAPDGRLLFFYCSACHTLKSGEPDKVGPNLAGVVGATAGTRGTYAYSAALRHSGIVWTDATLDTWLTQPMAFVPGTKMAFIGLPYERDRQTIIAYLKANAH